MIRINLLGASKQKKQHAAAATMEVGDVGSPRVKVLVMLVVALLINAGWWYQLDKQKQDIASQMQVAEQKNRELADVKARYLERQRQAQNYKRRVDVIDQLRKNQTWSFRIAKRSGNHGQRHRSGVVELDERPGSQRRHRGHGA